LDATQRVFRLHGRQAMLKQQTHSLMGVRLFGIALTLLMVFGAAGAAQASDRYRDCQRRIDHERYELDRAVTRHGERSHQADHERRELDRLYDECRFR